jgi:hypothetical protein
MAIVPVGMNPMMMMGGAIVPYGMGPFGGMPVAAGAARLRRGDVCVMGRTLVCGGGWVRAMMWVGQLCRRDGAACQWQQVRPGCADDCV